MPIFEANLSLKSPVPQSRKVACKIPILQAKRPPVSNSGSVPGPPYFSWGLSRRPLSCFKKLSEEQKKTLSLGLTTILDILERSQEIAITERFAEVFGPLHSHPWGEVLCIDQQT